MMRKILSMLLYNSPGVLSRVVGLFSQRNLNIETLNVAPTNVDTLARMTVTTVCDHHIVDKITKHLNQLISVVMVKPASAIVRELMLVKIKGKGKHTFDIFRAQVIDVTITTTVQVTGDTDKLYALLQALSEVCEVVRTGVAATMKR